MQIPVKSIQVTVYEWALEFMYTKKLNKKTENFLFFEIENVFFNFLPFLYRSAVGRESSVVGKAGPAGRV